MGDLEKAIREASQGVEWATDRSDHEYWLEIRESLLNKKRAQDMIQAAYE